MKGIPPNQPDDGAEELDPRLEALVGAILDGGSLDWASPTYEATAAFHRELRIIADVADVQRSLASADSEIEGPAFPPDLPWHAEGLTIRESVGKGAFGEVFRAWDTQLHRHVALKLLFLDSGHEMDADRFLEEGRLLAKVRHPNVVTVYGAERIEGRVGLITEFIDGPTLSAVVRDEGPLRPDTVVSIGIDLCRALSAVHAAGLLHRDIKPQNVMREVGGRIVLMDFGAGHRGDVMAQALAGTPLFLAPEVLEKAPATPQSDVYSLGVLLHYILTGSYPVTGASLAEIRSNHVAGRRTPVRVARPDVPRRITEVIDRGTHPNPYKRHATADAFAAALAQTVRSRHEPALRAAVAMAATLLLVTVAVKRDWITIPGATRAGGNGGAGATHLAASATSTTITQLPVKDYMFMGRPSYDGRWLPYSDGDGNLWIWEVATQQAKKILANNGADEIIWGSAMSPDGRRVAYTCQSAGGGLQLRGIDADGSRRTMLWPADDIAADVTDLVPLEWSRDGRQILHLLERKDGSRHLGLVAADSGEQRVLASFTTGAPRQASLSPDGQLVVFDVPSGDNAIERDLMIVRTDGSSAPQPLLTGRFNDLHPSWTPDGKGIFFTSDRTGQIGGWLVPISSDGVAGEATFVARNLGRIWPLGLTEEGAYFYQLQVGAADVYTVAVDLTGAVPSGTPARVSETDALDHLGAAWSPDGESIAYIAQGKETAWDRGSHSIVIQDLASGRTRSLAVPFLNQLAVVSPRWSADSRQLLVRGLDLANRSGLFIIDAASGAVSKAILIDQSNRFDWSPDGQAIVYGRRFQQVVSRRISTGEETVLFDAPAHGLATVTSFAFSPDGRTIALSGMTKEKRRGLFLLSAERKLTEIYSTDRQLVLQAWSPDGQQVIFTVGGNPQPHQLMRIHVTGGAAVDMGIPIRGFPQVNRVVINPDGSRIAYTAGEPGVEVWMMQRFLPR